MNFRSRFIRFAAAMSAVGVIASQVPFAGGVALAQDDDPYPPDGGGGTGLVQGLVLGLVGIGIYSTLSDRTPPPPPPVETTGGGGATTPAGSQGTTPAAAPTQVSTIPIGDFTDPNLSAFTDNVERSGLKDELKQPGPYTVFAPTNAAFAMLGGETLADLQKPENAAKLKAVLQYHVVQGRYTMQDLRNLADGTQLPTLAGPPLTVTKMGNNVLVNGIQVVDNDIPASNGIIHPLGQVLSPPAAPPAP